MYEGNPVSYLCRASSTPLFVFDLNRKKPQTIYLLLVLCCHRQCGDCAAETSYDQNKKKIMQSTMKSSTGMYAVTLAMATMALTLALTRNATAQTDQFSSEADAISGTVTKTLVGLLPSTVTIAPVDQSNTTNSGSNDDSAASASQIVFGVTFYDFNGVNDSTSDSDSPGTDGGTADAATTNGSLLGGW